jgi:hypothetical protein
MMIVLAAWTGFRKNEIGSLSKRSLNLDANPPTATVAACYSSAAARIPRSCIRRWCAC